MLRVILDPNVLVSAAITPLGAGARILLKAIDGAFELITSPLLLAELESVLLREKFRRYLSEDEARAFVDVIRRQGLYSPDPTGVAPRVTEDPNDDYLVNLAQVVQADYLVSGDPHLTRLRGLLPVLTPREFRELLDSRS